MLGPLPRSWERPMADGTGKGPGAESPAHGAGQQTQENDRHPEHSTAGRSISATGEVVRRHLPELAAIDRWIVRDAAKVPKHPTGLHSVDASDRAIWCSLDRALSIWRHHPRRIAGVGYVMTGIHTEHPALRLVGIDLDKAFDELDELKPWAQRIVDAAGPCYWERSPSGIGLRGFLRGAIPAEMTQRFPDGGVELYDGRSGRYLTVTGVRYVPG
ncbi:MAG: hypothetical protein IT518_09855 [Burkholderiales bacterium]|nr:hypothetical protein [Burkholderiales bacterium]